MARTENLTIMFTDMVGYTQRTSEQSRDANRDLLRRHDALLLPVLAQFGGRLIKRIGDAMLVSFRSPTDAVRCGMALHDALAIGNGGQPEAARIQIRVALNVGEVRVERRDVFGEAVNVAARVESLTPAGEVYFTEAVYLAMNKAEVPSEPVGEHRLKGIPEPVRLFRVPARKVQRLVAEGEEIADTLGTLPFGGAHDAGTGFVASLQSWWRYCMHAPVATRRAGLALRVVLYGLLLAMLGMMVVMRQPTLLAPEVVVADADADAASADGAGAPAMSEAPEPTPPPDPKVLAREWLQRGHAAYARGARRDAAPAYAEALALDPALQNDPELAARLVGCLSWAHDLATPVIEAHPSPAIIEALVERTVATGPRGRERAATLLSTMGFADRMDLTARYLMDFEEAETCDTQIQTIRQLGAVADARAEPVLTPLAGPRGIRGWFAEKHCARDAAREALDAIAQRGG